MFSSPSKPCTRLAAPASFTPRRLFSHFLPSFLPAALKFGFSPKKEVPSQREHANKPLPPTPIPTKPIIPRPLPRKRFDRYVPKPGGLGNFRPKNPIPGYRRMKARRTSLSLIMPITARTRKPRPLFRKKANQNRYLEHAAEDRGQLKELDEEIFRVVQPGILNNEDQIFLQQMAALNINRAFFTKLNHARLCADRAASEAEERVQQRIERDEDLERLWEKEERRKRRLRREEEERNALRRLEKQRLEEERRRVAEELRARALLEEERRRQQEEKEAEQQRARLQQFREQLRREREMWAREEQQREERERIEKQQREEKERVERQQREERERVAREEAYARFLETARLRLEQQQQEANRTNELQKHFATYDAKWQVLKDNIPLDPLVFCQLPWPVLEKAVTPDMFTRANLQEFVFHPLRLSMEGKSRRDRVRAEVLKWHPDKFNAKVLMKVADWDRHVVAEAAGEVARVLTQMLAEETDAEQPAS